MTRKAKQAKPTTEAKQEPKQQEQPKQATPTEAKQQPKEQQQPKQQPKEQPTKKPKPIVKRITWTYFEKFNTSSNNRKSWVKETIERATQEPVMVKNLTKGQIMALINQVDRHNMTSEHKIVYKYDVKRGIVLLAPKRFIHQMEGEQK